MVAKGKVGQKTKMTSFRKINGNRDQKDSYRSIHTFNSLSTISTKNDVSCPGTAEGVGNRSACVSSTKAMGCNDWMPSDVLCFDEKIINMIPHKRCNHNDNQD